MDSRSNTECSRQLLFFVNGERVLLESGAFSPDATLLGWLRREARLTGTKLGCGEGGCGACTVMLSSFENGAVRHAAVNAW